VDLEEFIGSEKPLKRRANVDDRDALDTAADDGRYQADDEPAAEESSNPTGEFDSVEQLLQAYQQAKALLQEKTEESQRYRQMLEDVGNQSRVMALHADDEAVARQMRGYYDKDPFGATEAMIRRAQQEVAHFMDMKIAQSIQDERNFKRVLDEFLSDPANARLRPYEEELEFLIREKGLFPREAAGLLGSLEDKRELTARKRHAAAKEVRNRAAVESDGEIGEPLDPDRELNRVIESSKTLEDMFKGLRKLRL